MEFFQLYYSFLKQIKTIVLIFSKKIVKNWNGIPRKDKTAPFFF